MYNVHIVLNMHKTCGLGALFFYLFSSYFPADEKYCIFCPVGGNVSGFLSSNGEFCLVFKYVHVYI